MNAADFIVQSMVWLRVVEFMNYRFTVRDSHGGIFLQAQYMDADIYTGTPELQVTRKWLLSPHMTESEVIQTAFKCCLTSMEHRAREAFKFNGKRIFGPHFNVRDLAQICIDREDAGSRQPAQPRRIEP